MYLKVCEKKAFENFLLVLDNFTSQSECCLQSEYSSTSVMIGPWIKLRSTQMDVWNTFEMATDGLKKPTGDERRVNETDYSGACYFFFR